MVKPFIICCGAPKHGKTTSVLKSFQNSLTILTANNNGHYYRKLLTTTLKDNPNYKPPKKIKLIDTHATGVSGEYQWLKPGDAKSTFGRLDGDQIVADPAGGMLMPVSQIQEFERTVSTMVTKSLQCVGAGQPPPYDNLVVDEMGELLDRVHAEITPMCISEKSGKLDGRMAFTETGAWTQRMATLMRQLTTCGVGVCLVMHDREPDEGKKGGPRAPSASIAKKLVALSDGAIQLNIKDIKGEDGKVRVQRYWNAMSSEQWDIGLRGLEPEDAERIGPMELIEILELCGFDMV